MKLLKNNNYFSEVPDEDVLEPNAIRKQSDIKIVDSFNIKENKKKYSLHHVAFPGTWQIDLMWSKNNCFLLAIEVNTRYLFATRTNIYVPKYDKINKIWAKEEVKKSTVAVAKAFFDLMDKGWNPSVVVSDSESSLNSKQMNKLVYERFKIEHRTVPLVKDENGTKTSNHTSLAIVDRVTRTIKKWVYDRGWNANIVPKEEVDKFLIEYNNRSHRTLKKIFGRETTPTEVHNNMEMEIKVMKHFFKKNEEVRKNQPGLKIPIGTRVKVYNPPNSFGKRTRVAKPDPYEVISAGTGIYTVRNLTTNEIEKVPRIWLEYL